MTRLLAKSRGLRYPYRDNLTPIFQLGYGQLE
jgi:hypothetical protein